MRKMKFLILILAVAILASAAWGIGINFHCNAPTLGGTVSGHTGSLLGSTSVIQRIYNNSGPPDPADSAHLLHSGGTWVADHHVGDGTGADGKFDINTTSNQPTYLRVWENAGPARGGYYKTLGSYSPGDPLPSEPAISSFSTDYLADVPPAPTVSAGGFKLTWDSAKSQYLVDFALTARSADTPKVEVVSYTIRVKKEADDWTAGKVNTGGASWSITEDPDNPYFIAGGWYVAVASASNYFGSSDWGESSRFQIPTGGAGGGPVTLIFSLEAYEANKLVINSISVPPNLKDASGSPITTASQLIAYIDSQPGAGAGTVIVLGKWDPVAGTAVRRTPAGVGENFNLVAGEGYQLYVTKRCTLTLQGNP